MDTKLKNNKKASVVIAAAVIIISAIIFTLFYPTFKKEADRYYTESFPEDYFIENLYKSNYVLYKDLVDKVDQTNVNYQDLYLETQIQDVPSPPEELAYGSYSDKVEQLDEDIRRSVDGEFNEWRSNTLRGIAQQLDYCVIDHQTGQMIKNTGRGIEVLDGTDNSEERNQLPYDFYIKMAFDGAGNLDKLSVKGVNSDELLKKVQHIIKGSKISNYLPYVNNDNNGIFYGYSGVNQELKKIVTKVKSPQNVTFIYAMTREQLDSPIFGNAKWQEFYAYYQSGIVEIYGIILVIIAIIVLLLSKANINSLYKKKICKLSVELSFVLGLFIFVFFRELMATLVNYMYRGYFNDIYSKYLGFLPSEIFPYISYGINFIVLCFSFAAWYYVISSYGAVFEYGIGNFFKERSLIVRFVNWICSGCKKYIMIFKEEILHVDLEKKEKRILVKVVIANFIILAIICTLWVFGWFALIIYSIILYFILRKYFTMIQEQYHRLLKVTGSIAGGNLNTTFEENLGVFESYKGELLKIQDGLRKAVDEEVKSQRMKTELITNVSHDLKTPLTAITTYIDLLKEEGVTEEQQKEYIKVLEKKSLRLKFLIEDLFEVSKANSRNVTMNLVDVDIANLVRQVYLEYEDKIEEADLIFRDRKSVV